MIPKNVFYTCLEYLIVEENDTNVEEDSSKKGLNLADYGLRPELAAKIDFYNPSSFPSRVKPILETIKLAVTEGTDRELYNRLQNILKNK